MKNLFILVLFTGIQYYAAGQRAYWQQEVHYTIDVSLDDTAHTLNGFVKLRYINHSPDTIRYIWFHLWPNAYKNDRTAYSEQLLQNGRTNFYFSEREQRGYINRLDFRTDQVTLKTEDHPQYIDVVKVYLLQPLAPGAATQLNTPFHVKLPDNFDLMGHTGRSYQVTHWYPQPAVYDARGWHPMPYLQQGGVYNEFGSYDVRITLPKEYVVAATGELQNTEEKEWWKSRESGVRSQESEVRSQKPGVKKAVAKKTVTSNKKPVTRNKKPAPSIQHPVPTTQHPVPRETKTLRYTQNNIHDFAWFADRNFKVQQDTIQLASGKVVQAYCFTKSYGKAIWARSMEYIKDGVRYRSNLIGDYPYNTVSVVEGKLTPPGGMEYPTITVISPPKTDRELDLLIGHETGHNWFYGALANNEREHAWMDEGMNTYYDHRYEQLKYPAPVRIPHVRYPDDKPRWSVQTLAKEKLDQPVSTATPDFTWHNFNVMAYQKAGLWLKEVEQSVGTARFDTAMQAYYRQWQFRHPAPGDFQQTIEQQTGKDLDTLFAALHTKGPLPGYTGPKKIQPVFGVSFLDYERKHHINILPAIGYNYYDKFMLGLLLHNYNMPVSKFQFMLMPLYATGSKQVNGFGYAGYTWYTNNKTFSKIEAAVEGARFSSNRSVDTNNLTLYENFYKIVPYLRVYFKHPARSTVSSWLEARTYIIGEQQFNSFAGKADDPEFVSYAMTTANTNRYINQLTYGVENSRVLYPYDYQLQVQQGKDFYRVNLTGNFLFNYAKGGGMRVRVFAAKFGYIGGENIEAFRYQPKLLGVTGEEDYTYSNPFLGRTASYANADKPVSNKGLAAQQIMIRDGGFKLRLDPFEYIQGRSENWVAAVNFNSTLPKGMFPIELPLRIFADIGTYAEAWKKEAETSRFLFVAGLQVSLFKQLLNIYAPIVYSKEFRSNLKTLPEMDKFFKRLTFSIDVHRFNLRKVTQNKYPL
jgi:hypothetical protein